MITAAVIGVAGSVASQARNRSQQKKAAKKAREQQLEDEAQRRRSEVFAETEGEGLGNLGEVSLEIDDEEDEDIRSGNLAI